MAEICGGDESYYYRRALLCDLDTRDLISTLSRDIYSAVSGRSLSHLINSVNPIYEASCR